VRLADGGEHTFSQIRAQRLAQANGRSGFSLAQRGGSDSGDVNVFAIWGVFQALQNFQFDFGLVGTIEFQLFRQDSGLLGDFNNRVNFRCLSDFNI